MGSENRTWGAKLRPDQHEEMKELIDETGMNKSDAIKLSVDEYLEEGGDQRQNADIVSGNEWILTAFAFILGGQSFFEYLGGVVGSEIASGAFMLTGFVILVGLFAQNYHRLSIGGSQ